MKIINLTGHPVHLHGADGSVIELARSETPLRLIESVAAIREEALAATSIVIKDVAVTSPQELPAQSPGMRYIVSQLVARSLPERSDLLYPYDLVRDAAGRVVGAQALAKVVS